MKLKVAVSQYNVPEKAKDSYAKALEICKEAFSKGAMIVVLPETALGLIADVKNSLASFDEDISSLAKEANLFICTSYYCKENDNYFNQGVLVNPNGEILLKHKKVYLAPPEKETDGISSGDSLNFANSELGRLGMLICKDGFNKYSHFLYEKLRDLQTDMILIPTWSLGVFDINTENYVKTFLTYGSFLSRSFILVAGNTNSETKSFGQAMIIDPIDGVVKIGSMDKEEILIHEIDLDRAQLARKFDEAWQPKERII